MRPGTRNRCVTCGNVHGWSSTLEFDGPTSTLRWSESVEVYIPPSGTSSRSPGNVRIYILTRERCAPDIYRYTCIQVYRTRNCKLVGVWRTSIGVVRVWRTSRGTDRRRATHCCRCGGGIVEALSLTVIVTRGSPYDGPGPHTTLDLMHVHNSLGNMTY